MAYDEGLAQRIREHLSGHTGITERKMFGGIAFMHTGNMAVGVNGDELMVRVDPDEHDALLAQPGVRVFDMTGRPMKGWILVDVGSVSTEKALGDWIDRGLDFAGSLPVK